MQYTHMSPLVLSTTFEIPAEFAGRVQPGSIQAVKCDRCYALVAESDIAAHGWFHEDNS